LKSFKGIQISEDSSSDEWLYIVKSGSCRVMKSVLIDESARKNYFLSKFKRDSLQIA
jgi:hypothetical protein